MKLRKIFDKDNNNIPLFDVITGYLRAENYSSDSIVKIAELKRNKNGKVVPILLPTYHINDKIVLKRKKDIVGYRIIFYGKLFQEENFALIRKHCHSISTNEAIEFLGTHAKELAEIFKDKDAYKSYMLRLFFELGKSPYEFEITYKGEIIGNLTTIKELWNSDKQNIELLTYKK